MSTPLRTIGSPPRLTMRRSAALRPLSLCVATSRPVSSRPQVAALTNSDGLCPRCCCQLPWPILSRMSASRVAASGMRSSASARHISATPSFDDSANSCSRPCTRPARPLSSARSRTLCDRRNASACVCCACASLMLAWLSRPGSSSGSGCRVAAVMAARRGPAASGGVMAAAGKSCRVVWGLFMAGLLVVRRRSVGCAVANFQGLWNRRVATCSAQQEFAATGWGRFRIQARQAGALAAAVRAGGRAAIVVAAGSFKTPKRSLGSANCATSSTTSPMPSSAAVSASHTSAE